jgi:Fe-S-cluster containining protein
MNFPAIAKQTYESLKGQPAFSNITNFIIAHLKRISSPLERARFVHHVVDDYNRTVFSHPLVKELSPCKAGCSGCCHTQVSITEDEAELLASIINDGLKIDLKRLNDQYEASNSSEDFYKLSYNSRKCIFLGEDDRCQVYNDRPSVCRTNSVLGEASQCSTQAGLDPKQTLRLVKTAEADMAMMGAFLSSKNNGTLAYMVRKFIEKSLITKVKPNKKSISKLFEL